MSNDHEMKMKRIEQYEKIAGHLPGNTFVIDPATGDFRVDGISVLPALTIMEERSRVSSWRSSPTGKLRISVGTFGSRKAYPQRANGEFNYTAIAEELASYVRLQQRRADAAAHRASRQRCVHELKAKFNLPDYTGLIDASASSDVTINFTTLGTKNMTQEKADAVLTALRDLQLI